MFIWIRNLRIYIRAYADWLFDTGWTLDAQADFYVGLRIWVCWYMYAF